MTTLFSPIREFFKKGDVLLLFLCLTASGYGLALIYSATRYLDNNNRNVIVQAVAICIGVVIYIVLTLWTSSCSWRSAGSGWWPLMWASFSCS